jgi:hypothetical protein
MFHLKICELLLFLLYLLSCVALIGPEKFLMPNERKLFSKVKDNGWKNRNLQNALLLPH